MKSNKKTILVLLVLVIGAVVGSVLYAQDPNNKKSEDGRTSFITEEFIGKEGSKTLHRVVVDTFEESGEWYAAMPNDQGLITSRRQKGVPRPLRLKDGEHKEVKTARKGDNAKFRKADGTYQKDYFPTYLDKRKFVLGVRVDFQKRGNNWFATYPYRPIKLEGLVKTFEVWVAGRQKNHRLFIMVEDIYGDTKIIPMGKLNFLGWKRLYVHVPDQIDQFDYTLSHRRGLVFKGFLIKCDPLESRGRYYIYFDNLTAEVSRFWEEYQDEKDPVDNW